MEEEEKRKQSAAEIAKKLEEEKRKQAAAEIVKKSEAEAEQLARFAEDMRETILESVKTNEYVRLEDFLDVDVKFDFRDGKYAPASLDAMRAEAKCIWKELGLGEATCAVPQEEKHQKGVARTVARSTKREVNAPVFVSPDGERWWRSPDLPDYVISAHGRMARFTGYGKAPTKTITPEYNFGVQYYRLKTFDGKKRTKMKAQYLLDHAKFGRQKK